MTEVIGTKEIDWRTKLAVFRNQLTPEGKLAHAGFSVRLFDPTTDTGDIGTLLTENLLHPASALAFIGALGVRGPKHEYVIEETEIPEKGLVARVWIIGEVPTEEP